MRLTIEHGIAAEIANTLNTDGVIDCCSKIELKEITYKVFNTKRMVEVIQELINASEIVETKDN